MFLRRVAMTVGLCLLFLGWSGTRPQGLARARAAEPARPVSASDQVSATAPTPQQPRWTPAALAYARQVETTPGWVTVLEYHDIGPNPKGYRYVITPGALQQQMAALAASHRPVLTVATLAADLLDGTVPHGAVVLTFDDGYVSVYTTARPILARYGFPATCFVIGLYTYVPAVGVGHMSIDQLQALQHDGWDMESHTFNLHPPAPINFTNAPVWFIDQDLDAEDALLEAAGNPHPIAFAYPGGDVSASRLAPVESRYLLAFVGEGRAASYAPPPYAWPRKVMGDWGGSSAV